MAIQIKALSVLAYANGFTLWHYVTADTLAAVEGAGYFAAASDMLRAGDMILVNAGHGGRPAATLLLVGPTNGEAVTMARAA